MSDAQVKVAFRIQGEDAASAEIDRVRGSVGKLGPVLSGVGSLATSEFSKLGQGATMVSGVMNLIPGQWGMIAGAAVGAGVVIYNVLNREKQAAEEAFEAHKKRLQELRQSIPDMADRYGVEIDLIQKKASVEEWTKDRIIKNLRMLTEAEEERARSEKAGNEAGVESATAWMAKIHDGNRVLKQRLDLLNQQRALEDAEKQGNADRLKSVELAQAKVAAATDKESKAHFQILAFREKQNEIDVRAVQLAAKRATGVVSVTEAERQSKQIEIDRLRLAAEINSAKEKETRTTRATRAAAKETLDAATEEAKVQAALYRFAQSTQALKEKRSDRQATTEIELLRARIEAATGPEARQALELEAIDLEQKQALIEATRELADNEVALANKKATIVQASINKVAVVEKRAEVEKAQAAAEDLRRTQEREDSYVSMSQSGVEALEAIGVGEQALAGIKAAISAAEGLLAFARGDYAGAAAGAAAAVAFGAQALGVGSYASPASSGGGGGGGASGAGGYSNTTSGGGPGPITIVVQGALVTKQQIGQAIHQALGSTAGTGLVAKAGV